MMARVTTGHFLCSWPHGSHADSGSGCVVRLARSGWAMQQLLLVLPPNRIF